MDIAELINKIGPSNIDMLLCNDDWLQNEYKIKAMELGETLTQLRRLELVRDTKRRLQQVNKVAVQRLVRDNSGDISDVVISIMDLPDAAHTVTKSVDVLDDINNAAQLQTWHNDGYDITNSYNLRLDK